MIKMDDGEDFTSDHAQRMREQLMRFDNVSDYAARFNEPPDDCEIGRMGPVDAFVAEFGRIEIPDSVELVDENDPIFDEWKRENGQ